MSIARPFARVQRVGGLTHVRIGRTGCSVYGLRHTKPWLAIAALSALAVSCAPQSDAPTYAAILTTASGNEYAIETGVTRDDCYALIADMPISDARCEIDTAQRAITQITE